jgi:hypothetical protein
MRICDLHSSIGRLQRETKQLQEKWAQTKQQWRDHTCQEFETKYLEPLLPNLKLTIAATYELAEILNNAEKELGDHAT